MKREVNILTVLQQLQLQYVSLIPGFICDKSSCNSCYAETGDYRYGFVSVLLGLCGKMLWVSIVSIVSSCGLDSSGFEP